MRKVLLKKILGWLNEKSNLRGTVAIIFVNMYREQPQVLFRPVESLILCQLNKSTNLAKLVELIVLIKFLCIVQKNAESFG